MFYRDPTDSLDTARALLFTRSTRPLPMYGWYLDSNGDGSVDRAVVKFSSALTQPPDSILVWFPDSSTRRIVRAQEGLFTVNGTTLSVQLSPPFTEGSTGFTSGTTGNGRSWSSAGDGSRERAFEMRDSVGPVLVGTALFESRNGTVMLSIRFSEPIDQQSMYDTALVMKRGSSAFPVRVVKAQGLNVAATEFLVEVILPPGVTPRTGDSLAINHRGPLRDWRGNGGHLANRPVALVEKIGAPQVVSAGYFDLDADGIIDRARIHLERPGPPQGLHLVFTYAGSRVAVSSDRAYPVPGDSMRIEVALRGLIADSAFVTTGGTMTLSAVWEAFPGDTVRAPVLDSAAAVILRAVYSPGAGPGVADSLEIEYSEEVSSTTVRSPFLLYRSDPRISWSLALRPISGQRARVHRFLVEEIIGVDYPHTGDSIQIDPAAGIVDALGNRQISPANRLCPLQIKAMPFTISVQAVPNPFNPGETTVPRHVPSASPRGVVLLVHVSAKSIGAVDLNATGRIYDALGNWLAQGVFVPGGETGKLYWVWDGRNRQKRFVGTGTYLGIVVTQDKASGRTQSSRVKIGVVR